MGKYDTGELYNTGILYGPTLQHLLGVGNIPSTAALGMPMVNPGPVTIHGVGNIPTGGALGTPWIFRVPKKMAVDINVRRLKVTPDG